MNVMSNLEGYASRWLVIGAFSSGLLGCGGISESELAKHSRRPEMTEHAEHRAPTVQEVVTQTKAATIGYVSDAGRFNVRTHLRLSSGPDGAMADLLVSGGNDEGTLTMGMSLPLTSGQTSALLHGDVVPVSSESMLGYGYPTGQVMRGVRTVRLERAAAEVWRLMLELAPEAIRMPGSPSKFGTAREAVFMGELTLECLAPGSTGREQFVQEDPDGRTAFCSQAIRQYDLAGLLK
jgi:hypothetical protein